MKLPSKLLILITAISLMLSGCATNSQNRTLTTILAGVVCFAVGAATAKDDEEPYFYGSAGATPCLIGAHAVNERYFSDRKKLQDLKEENDRLNSLREFRITKEGTGSFVDKNGKKENVLFRISEGVRWNQKDENTRVKEVMEVKRISLEDVDKEKSKKKSDGKKD